MVHQGEQAFVEAMAAAYGEAGSATTQGATGFAYKKMAQDKEINATGISAGKIKRLFVKYQKLVGPLPDVE
jgi:hypothetical protein